MFTWKRFFLASSILCVIVIIGWITWYFTIVHPKLIRESAMQYNYNTESQIAADATSVETSQRQKISQVESETVDRYVEGGGTENAAPLVSKELNQHTHHLDKPNDEELSAAELAKKKAEMESERKEFEAYKNRINESRARLNELNKHAEIRNEELANHLNSLSAKKQQAYFENIRSGKVLEELPPDFFEVTRANLLSKEFSEETIEKVLKGFKQEIQKFASEAGAKRHLEMLRDSWICTEVLRIVK